jgi:hypothetical protein
VDCLTLVLAHVRNSPLEVRPRSTSLGRNSAVGAGVAPVRDGTPNEVAELHESMVTDQARRPWKLPEPWTPRTRPPLLGKRTERVFHTYHRLRFAQVFYPKEMVQGP